MKGSALLLLLLMGTVCGGCHKKEATASAPSPVAENPAASTAPVVDAQTPPPGPVDAPAHAPTPIPQLPPPPRSVTANADNVIRQSVVGEVDAFLTTQLRTFVQKNGRMPQSFFELSLKTLDSMPRPPEGKHWVIDATDVSVKSVANK